MVRLARAHEVIFRRQLLTNLGEKMEGPTPMFNDNEGCTALATNDITSAKTKHIDTRHHFVRDLVKSKALEIVWISTSEMIANILTESTLPISIHKKHTDRMQCGTYSSGPIPRPVALRSVDIHFLALPFPSSTSV